jgi:hypothetical protein
MRMMKAFGTAATLAVVLAAGTVALRAAINIDEEGNGFVGKGDVQLLFLWNNAQLQSCASSTSAQPGDAGCLRFEFTAETSRVEEVSWVCTNSNNENAQERSRTTTTTVKHGGVVATVARVKNQVTGFNLGGLEPGVPELSSGPLTEGPQLNSCPSGPWTLTTPAGDPVAGEGTASLELTVTDTRNGGTSYAVRSTDGTNWTPVQ